jgi:hypothetical protein
MSIKVTKTTTLIHNDGWGYQITDSPNNGDVRVLRFNEPSETPEELVGDIDREAFPAILSVIKDIQSHSSKEHGETQLLRKHVIEVEGARYIVQPWAGDTDVVEFVFQELDSLKEREMALVCDMDKAFVAYLEGEIEE